MKDLDNHIREALRSEDTDLYNEIGDQPSIFEQVLETFRGRHSWLTFLGVFWGIVFMVLGVLSAIRFFNAEDTRDLLLWGLACVICIMAVSMMKIWYWMELNKNALTREIKRLELQVARLAGRIKD